MKPAIVIAIVLTVMLGMVPAMSSAQNELFDTKTASTHVEKGLALLKAKNYDAAINEFEEAAAIYPDAESYYFLGYAYYLKSKQGDGENRMKSRENFEKAYELDPGFSPGRTRQVETIPGVTEKKPDEARTTSPAAAEPPVKPAAPAEEQQPAKTEEPATPVVQTPEAAKPEPSTP